MKPAPFVYHAPTTVDEAVELLATLEEPRALAGGQSLLVLTALRLSTPSDLVDLNSVVGLDRIEKVDGMIRLGAMVRQSAFERSVALRGMAPLFAEATPYIGHFQIRSRGTLGGSLAHADPAAEYPAVAIALDADFEIVGASGGRSVSASSFFQGGWTTSLEADEVLVAIRFQPWSEAAGFGVAEVARRRGDFAVAGAVCGLELGSDRLISRASLALFGVNDVPVHATEAEQMLVGSRPSEVIERAARAARAGLHPPDDIHASGTYRQRVVPTVAAEALRQALESCTSEASSPAKEAS